MTDKVPLHDRIEEGNKVDSELDQSLAWVFNQEIDPLTPKLDMMIPHQDSWQHPSLT